MPNDNTKKMKKRFTINQNICKSQDKGLYLENITDSYNSIMERSIMKFLHC